MPERWQSELRRLRSVEMPPTMRDRIESGPTGGPDRRARSRIVAAVVAFVVFGAGGGFAWLALRPAEEIRTPTVGGVSERVLVTLSFEERAGSPYPRGTLTFSNETVEATFASYGWCGGDYGCGIADTATPELDRYVPIPAGTELLIETDAARVVASLGEPTYPFGDERPIELVDGRGVLEGDLGRHGLTLQTHWEDGEFSMDAPLYFGIELVEPALPTPTPTTSPSEEASVSPPTPTPTTAAAAWWDVPSELEPVGTVCGATSVDGDFGEVGVRAWVFEPEPEGGCDGPNENFQYIGIEGANGELVMHSEELRECLDSDPCWAFSAPDLDEDGVTEVAVGTSHEGSAVWLSLYRLNACPVTETCEWWLYRLEIAEPGDPHEGYPPGPALFAWGGSTEDPAGAEGIVCETYEGAPAIVHWFTATYDQWMVVDGSTLRLVFPEGGEHIPEGRERLDDFCGASISDVPL